jgi:hypothetical protein
MRTTVASPGSALTLKPSERASDNMARLVARVPDVGRDEDFARVDDAGETPRVPR